MKNFIHWLTGAKEEITRLEMNLEHLGRKYADLLNINSGLEKKVEELVAKLEGK